MHGKPIYKNQLFAKNYCIKLKKDLASIVTTMLELTLMVSVLFCNGENSPDTV